MTTTTSVTMSAARYAALTARAKADGITRPEVLRRALDDYTASPSMFDQGAASRDAEVKGLTDSLQLTGVQYKAAQGTIADLRAQVAELTATKHPVPADAVTLPPGSTKAVAGKVNIVSGAYPNFSWTAPNGTETTIIVPDGQTATFDGGGVTKNALTAGGKLHLYGDLRIVNYAPTTSQVNATGAAVFYGSTAAGSEIDGPTIAGSKMIGLAFGGKLILTSLTVTDSGHAGILGTVADGMRFGDVRVIRPNRGGYNPNTDGQVAGIKMTRSANLVLTKGVYVEAANGANGLWTDVSCRNPTFAGCQVISNGAPAYIGLQVEETEGGTVVGCTIEGRYAGSLMATGHAQVWNSTFTGTVLGLQVRQDRPKNTGKTAANLTPTVAPWWAVGNVVANNQLLGPVALAVYADAAYGLAATDMLDLLAGNTYGGTVSLGDAAGKRANYTLAQMASLLGSKFSSAKLPMPAEVAAASAYGSRSAGT